MGLKYERFTLKVFHVNIRAKKTARDLVDHSLAIRQKKETPIAEYHVFYTALLLISSGVRPFSMLIRSKL